MTDQNNTEIKKNFFTEFLKNKKNIIYLLVIIIIIFFVSILIEILKKIKITKRFQKIL